MHAAGLGWALGALLLLAAHGGGGSGALVAAVEGAAGGSGSTGTGTETPSRTRSSWAQFSYELRPRGGFTYYVYQCPVLVPETYTD